MNRTDSLALFVKAVDTGSLSGAARALRLSLPSVSRHITALEERIGTRLVIRTTRSLALTEAGRIYYEHAKQILAHLDEIEANLLADTAVPSGKVSVWGPTLSAAFFWSRCSRGFLLTTLASGWTSHCSLVPREAC